jgi:Rho GTPase-activating protein 1
LSCRTHHVVSCEGILKTDLDIEGLFRQSASASEIEAAKRELKQIKQGQRSDLDLSRYNPHVAATLLKTFLRELSDPIIPSQYFTNLIEIGELPKTEHVTQLKKLIASLPRTRVTVLSHLCKFLHEVAQHGASNRMTSTSLSICFTPVMCWSHDAQSIENSLQVPRLSNAIASLIENAPTIFP